jgi:hypothetical protein
MKMYNVPEEIKNLRQWVNAKEGSKVPMMSSVLLPASSTNPDTWSDYNTAVLKVLDNCYDYIGFVFNDNGFVGVDIDDGFDEEGFISPLAADIIGKCKSYTEKSKSGTGFHILLRGDLPFKGKNNRNGVEIYKTARYFIMTGDRLLYDAIIDNQEAIDYIVDKYFPEMRESENKGIVPKIYTPVWDKPTNDGQIRLRPIYNPIPDGARNISLTSLAGQWHNIGYSGDEIYKELLYVNAVACRPPLDNNEVWCIVNSVTRYRR